MPDIGQAADWVTLSDAMSTSAESGRPIFAVVAAPWSTGAHLVSTELATPSLQQVIADQFIPVHIDPVTAPDVTGKVTAVAQYQMGNGALPLLAILSAEGNPLLATHYTAPEHRDSATPSIEGLLTAVAEQWNMEPEAFISEWEQAKTVLAPNNEQLERDTENGGFLEPTKELHAYQLADIAGESTDDPWLLHTLARIWSRGVRDQLEASFHPGTRDTTWVIPYFEKVLPQNSAMALAYASAAARSKNRELRSQAQDLVRYCLNAFMQGTDVISAESRYYTWLSTELYDAVSRVNLQAVALLHNVQPKANRQVLSPVRTVAEIAAISFDDEATINTRQLAGHAEMLMHRRTRPTPRPIKMENPTWRAESYRWLLLAMESLESSDQSLVHNAFISWFTGKSNSMQQVDVTDAESFQGQVSLLAGLLLAKSRTRDASIDATLTDVYENVQKGIAYWSSVDEVDRLWLHQHGYLPSVEATLRVISELLPEGEVLPPLV